MKSIVTGEVIVDGEVTVEAHGIFILPRWARESGAADKIREALSGG